jgi:predicted RecB family nuclease
MLYDLVACPHRVWMDLYGHPMNRDPINPFVQLLWERGAWHEKETIASLRLPFLDLSLFDSEEKERRTHEAMKAEEPLIYGGRISADDLLGEPDLLRFEGRGYAPIDIKCGAGEEGPSDDRKPKLHYAVQLALYMDILDRLGLSSGRHGFIWDVNGEEVAYDLTAPQGVRNSATLWDEYTSCLTQSRRIVQKQLETLPSYSPGVCGLCHWYSACLDEMRKDRDLTLIPELGRSRRDVMAVRLPSIDALAKADLGDLISGKKTVFPGIGVDTLNKFQKRAKMLSDPASRPCRNEEIVLPSSELEIFFDIEVDPFRKHCYLHGFLERHGGDNSTERYVAFFTDRVTAELEEDVFAAAWRYLQESRPYSIYFYSKYERTWWRALRSKYPSVCSESELEDVFNPPLAVDSTRTLLGPRPIGQQMTTL